MRRVLIPLDGTELAASILPDARRVAGPDGTLILIRNSEPPTYVRGTRSADTCTVDAAYDYLNAVAESLRSDGMNVETHVLVLGQTAFAIDEAAAIYGAEMIAVATHGRSPFGRLVHGSVAWKAIAHSGVPVLLRHPDRTASAERVAGPRRILVPLDGSQYAERAVRLACQLAGETAGELILIQVIPPATGYATLGPAYLTSLPPGEGEVDQARDYLDSIALPLSCRVRTEVVIGPVSSTLVAAVRKQRITDVVIASHGRTGLSRVLLGSVTDELIQQLHCPIVVLPALMPEESAKPADGGASASVPAHLGA